MADTRATAAILDWMYSTRFEDIPPDVRRMALLGMYDAIGGDLACSLLPAAHRMFDFVKLMGGSPDCSMMGSPMRTSLMNAALVNGTLGHADEVDPVGGSGMGAHIMAATMGASLAAGQYAGASGQEVLRAVVLGGELSRRVHTVGVHSERDSERAMGRTFGLIDAGNTMGAVAAAGIALGLPRDRMDVALSLAATMACGITPFGRETGHMVKSFVRGGVGAKNGAAAAVMAMVGYDAPRDIFDGSQGFFHSRLGIQDPGAEFLAGLGEDWGIRGMGFKRRSCGGPDQAPSQILIDMMAENGLTAEDLKQVDVEVEPGGFNTMTRVRHPSIYGKSVLALAAVYRGMGFREAHQEAYYNSPSVLALEERINIQVRRDWTGHDHHRTVVAMTTMDGRAFSKEDEYRPMTEEELDAKFSYLVGLRAGEAKATALARVLKRLDTVGNIADVMVQLEFPEASIDQV